MNQITFEYYIIIRVYAYLDIVFNILSYLDYNKWKNIELSKNYRR